MFSFWPSFTLAIFFLVIFVECRTIAGRATLPLGAFIKFFIFGSVGASLLCLLVQQSSMIRFDSNFARLGGWLFGPPIEGLATALPVIWLAFFTTVWRRLSLADLALAGFASGAGFAFVKSNLPALAFGTLPSFDTGIALGLQSMQGAAASDVIFFSGYAVNAALFGLAAGIGLRLYPVGRVWAWVPAACVFVWACFDHGIYNWKVFQHAIGAPFPQAATPVEFLHLLTLRGQLANWVFPAVLIAAQIAEAKLCTRLLGKRSDLLLPFERNRSVINEWFVAFVNLWRGRAVFELTLAFFRHRRQFALASLEACRDPGNRALAQYTRVLEQRLVRERAILFKPPHGAWFPPRALLARKVTEWAWRSRWVLAFGVLCIPFFMLSPRLLPPGSHAVLFGNAAAAVVVAIGLGVAIWRAYDFFRMPRLDPVACDGTAFAQRHARALLLIAALACGVLPGLVLVLHFAVPGTFFFGGAFSAWVGQGGNLYALLGLGALAGVIEADPAPIGAALRDDIEAGEARIRRVERRLESKSAFASRRATDTSDPFQELIALIEQRDAERDMQGRRKLALVACERHAAQMRVANLGVAFHSVIEEFERLRIEFTAAATKERERIAALEEAHDEGLAHVVQELEAYDRAHLTLRRELRDHYRPRKDMEWALRIARTIDDIAPSVRNTYLADLEGFARQAVGESAELLNNTVERIRYDGSGEPKPSRQTISRAPSRNDRPSAPLGDVPPEVTKESTDEDRVSHTGLRKDDAHIEETRPDEGASEPAPVPAEVSVASAPIEPVAAASVAEPAELEADSTLAHCVNAPGWTLEEPDGVNDSVRLGDASVSSENWEWAEADEAEPLDHAKWIGDIEFEQPPRAQLQALFVLSAHEVPDETSLLTSLSAPGWSTEDLAIAGWERLDSQDKPLEGEDHWREARANDVIAFGDTDDPLHAGLLDLLNIPPPELPTPQQEAVARHRVHAGSLSEMTAPGWSTDDLAVAGWEQLGAQDKPLESEERWGAAPASDVIAFGDSAPEEPLHAQLRELLDIPPPELPTPQQEAIVRHSIHVRSLSEMAAPGWSMDEAEIVAKPEPPGAIGTYSETLDAECEKEQALDCLTATTDDADEPLHIRLQEVSELSVLQLPEPVAQDAVESETPISAGEPANSAAVTTPALPESTPGLSTFVRTQWQKLFNSPEADAGPEADATSLGSEPAEPTAPTRPEAHSLSDAAPATQDTGKELDSIFAILNRLEAAMELRNPSPAATQEDEVREEKAVSQPPQETPQTQQASVEVPTPQTPPAIAPVAQQSEPRRRATDFAPDIKPPELLFGAGRKRADNATPQPELNSVPRPADRAEPVSGKESAEPIRIRSRKFREGIDDPREPPTRASQNSDGTRHAAASKEEGFEPIRIRSRKYRDGIDDSGDRTPRAPQGGTQGHESGSVVHANGVRGVGRGKFIKRGADEAPSRQVPTGSSGGIRSAKFFGSVKSANGNSSTQASSSKQPQGSLAEVLSDYYGKNGEVPPPMHTVDSETLEHIINCGRLETSAKGTAPWSYSGIPPRGDVAIRLRRGADRFIEFVPSSEAFGQTPVYYPNRVGVGDAETFIPLEHLEYFDVNARQWRSLAAARAA